MNSIYQSKKRRSRWFSQGGECSRGGEADLIVTARADGAKRWGRGINEYLKVWWIPCIVD